MTTHKERTNKYFVTGVFQMKTFSISTPKSVKSFAATITVEGIRNETPANLIHETILSQVEVFVNEQANGSKIAMKEIQVGVISLLDSFENTIVDIEEPARATA